MRSMPNDLALRDCGTWQKRSGCLRSFRKFNKCYQVIKSQGGGEQEASEVTLEVTI